MEEKCLNHIESNETYFRQVHYEIIKMEHQNFFESMKILEDTVMENKLSEDVLFSMVMSFNKDIEDTNILCERYDMQRFPEYHLKSLRFKEAMKDGSMMIIRAYDLNHMSFLDNFIYEKS